MIESEHERDRRHCAPEAIIRTLPLGTALYFLPNSLTEDYAALCISSKLHITDPGKASMYLIQF